MALLSDDDLLFQLEHVTRREGLRSFCRSHQLDAGNVSNVLARKRPMQKSIAQALGYKKVNGYVPFNT